jgi:hypothetical protein
VPPERRQVDGRQAEEPSRPRRLGHRRGGRQALRLARVPGHLCDGDEVDGQEDGYRRLHGSGSVSFPLGPSEEGADVRKRVDIPR